MNSWSATRKRIILSLIVLALVLLVGVPIFFLFYDKPTCADGRLNGDETGIDCGGSCELLCSAESLPLLSRGDTRLLSIAPGIYEVVHVVENPNVRGEVYRARYTIKLYEASSTPIKIIVGETFIPKAQTFVLFEGPFELANATPTRATLQWHEDAFVWRKNVSLVPEIVVENKVLSGESVPRVDAVVANSSLERVSNIELVALLKDANENIIGASRTFVDNLARGERAPIVFTWPRPFAAEVVSIEVIPRIFPDKSFIR